MESHRVMLDSSRRSAEVQDFEANGLTFSKDRPKRKPAKIVEPS